MKNFLCCLSLFLVVASANAQEGDTVLLEDLRFQWVQLQDSETIPVTGTNDLKLVSFSIELKSNQILKICNDQTFDVWVDLRLLNHENVSCISLGVEDFQRFNSEALDIQVSSSQSLKSLRTEIWQVVPSDPDDLSIHVRAGEEFRNYYLICLLLFVLSSAVFRRYYPVRFSRMWSSPVSLGARSSFDDFYSGFFSIDNLLALVYFSFLASLPILYVNHVLQFATQIYRSQTLINVHTVYVLSILGLMIFRYTFSSMLASFFKFKDWSNIQNQDFVNFFSWICFIGLIITLVDFSIASFAPQRMFTLTTYMLMFSVVIYQFSAYLKIDRVISHQKIMIISYLCTTEFIPGVILIYLLIK